MNRIFFLSFACAFLFCFSSDSDSDSDSDRTSSTIIRLPMTFVQGYGSFPVGYDILIWKNTDSADALYKTEHVVKGIPSDWEKTVKKMIWFDAKQFVYQNYKAGKLSQKEFNGFAEAWKIDVSKRPYSAKPLKCYVYVIMGKNKDGGIRLKIDSNNNLDFSDEPELNPYEFQQENDWDRRDSIAAKFAIDVQYEGLRDGLVTTLTAPIFICRMNGKSMMRNFSQHAECKLDGKTIMVCSGGFTSTSYDPVAISVDGQKPASENEFISINDILYRNLGVNIDEQVLFLEKMGGTTPSSSQVGFAAPKFDAIEFSSQEKISLQSYTGKYLYLEFWGTWCAPCRAEIPNLVDAYQRLDKSKIEFLGVAVHDKPESLQRVLKDENIQWNQILCNKKMDIDKAYNVIGYPTSFLIDPSGKIIAKDLQGKKLFDTLNYYIKSVRKN